MNRVLVWSIVACLVAAAAMAQTGGAREQPGVHIVRPGDTLRGLTRQHLGSEQRWRENWRLNPEIEDPDLLVPGQRIRILVPQSNARVPTARVIAVAGEVEERPAPVDWLGAETDDLMLERDALRTRASSSSALLFPDGSQLAVTEDSLVYLRRSGRSLEGVDDRSVEIVEGQAELAAVEPVAPRAEIEILIGNATATPSSDEQGEIQTRARKLQQGGAAVMVYKGRSEVEAGGEVVEMDSGMGVSVPADGPLPPPEPLLAAPLALAPQAGARLDFPDPEFDWRPVSGAVSYIVEVCADENCLELVVRRGDLESTSWRSAPLPVATHHWRVTAVSGSGLDGFPSPTRAVTVLSNRRDGAPPTARFALDGPAVKTGDRLYYAPSSRVTIEVEDDRTGVASWNPVIDGAAARQPDLAGPWGDGEHTVEARVVDGAGNRGIRSGLRFVVDGEPPELEWEVASDQAMDQLLTEIDQPTRWRKRWRDWQKRAASSSRNGGYPATWTMVAWSTDAVADGAVADWSLETLKWRERRSHQTLTHAGSSPAVLIAAPRLRVPDRDGALGSELLLLRAVDGKAGTRTLTLRTLETGGGVVLEVETLDRLGNRRVERLPFVH